MTDDPTVIVMGEDVAVAGGPFKVTEGLLATHGPDRVIDTPISEMAFLGAGVGAAVCGLKPVVEIMFIEFLGVALDQLTTQAATMRYLSRGKLTVPMVVRASVGAGQGFGRAEIALHVHCQRLFKFVYVGITLRQQFPRLLSDSRLGPARCREQCCQGVAFAVHLLPNTSQIYQ